MRNKSICGVILFLLLSLIHHQCANPVSPQGGPEDRDPPEVIACEPLNNSILFNSKVIRLTFNEFVELKSSGSGIVVSPPVSSRPEYKIRKKSLVIELTDTLLPNTTYIINFGKSITDITEGNALSDYRYVFSTGEHIDSLVMSGQMINAFDNQPVPEVYALLYTDSVDTIPFDSLPYKVPPIYIAQSNKQGVFNFTNLRDDKYKLFGLGDQSGDFIYNMPAEMIAFHDSLVNPWIGPKVVPDSLKTDTIIRADTIPHVQLILKMFEGIDSTQEILRADLVKNDEFIVVFKYPPKQPFIIPLNLDSSDTWCMKEYSVNHDTTLLWITTELSDSLILKISDRDTVLDTVYISPTKITKKKRGKKEKEKEEEPEFLTFSWEPRGGRLNHFKSSITGICSYPVGEHDFSRVLLITEQDTLNPAIEFIDSLSRKFRIDYKWREASSYSVLIPDSTFFSYNGWSHDTVRYSFQTVVSRELGSLLINVDMSESPGNYIFQLQNEKEKTLEEKLLNESGEVIFSYINPGKYTIKAILDANHNERWDTGDYMQKIQPEKVLFFPKMIEIRGNWDVEEEWNL